MRGGGSFKIGGHLATGHKDEGLIKGLMSISLTLTLDMHGIPVPPVNISTSSSTDSVNNERV